ncbi:transmembrane protein, putative (macronuclear) [Tetrahymena thermophila SB210]|uniref:Transmembrane protein, putative n=1 Tax=Tetrahymena thermophila (strain SB210) TaxID=312017 RepID=I7MFH9_TETTS|nr:transmembrane protein, putative [Tetrahymena thermophila SB210]EAR99907.2 transmembrane protein, putative [Tetrahymena thermophila SB210]|eukprot:XP_001020152.2 transmembrane protein, putative [Tetrahymena thermophila SB210]
MENNNLTNIYSSAADCQLLNFENGFIQIEDVLFSLTAIQQPFQQYMNILKYDIFPCLQIFIQNSKAIINDYSLTGYYSQQYLSSVLQNNLILNQINCNTLIKNITIKNLQLQQYQSLISSQYGFLNITQSKFKNIFKDYQKNKDYIQQQSQSYISTLNTIFQITQTQFKNIFCSQCKGGIFFFEKSNGQINNCTFSNNTSITGGSIYFQNLIEQTTIISCIFEQNESLDGNGGAISIYYNQQPRFILNILHSNFSGCSSQNQGGAIAIIQQEQQNYNLVKLQNLFFTDNIAKIAGALYYQNIIPVQENIFYHNNNAQLFGTNFYSGFPTSLKIINNKQIISLDHQSSFITNFRSGDTLQEIQIQFYDQNDQPIIIQEQDFKNTWIQIDNNSNEVDCNLQGVQVAQYLQDKSYIKIPENILTGIPQQQITLNIYSDQIYKIYNNQIVKQNLIHQIKINFRECLLGEIKLESIQDQYLNRTLIQCIRCNTGTYSFDFQKCSACPQGAKCYGGSNVSVSQGYWRSNILSTNIIQCINQDDTSCVGGYGAGDQLCKKGYIGSLCLECDEKGIVWGSKYIKRGFQCYQCYKTIFNAILISLSLSIINLSIYLSIRNETSYTTQEEEQRKSGILQSLQIKKSISFNSKIQYFKIQKSSQSAIIIKFFTHYLKIITQVQDLNIKLTKNLFNLPGVLELMNPISSQINALQCFLDFKIFQIPLIYSKFLLQCFLPLIYFLSFLLLIRLVYLLKGKKFNFQIVIAVFFFIFFYFQIDIFQAFILLVSCIQIENKSYILQNITYECYTDQSKFYLLAIVTPIMIIYVFIIPILIFILLYKNKQQLEFSELQSKFGYLLREYRVDKYYWEFVRMIERMIIVIILGIYSQDSLTKSVLIFLTIITYFFFLQKLKPYQKPINYNIDCYMSITFLITFLLQIFSIEQNYIYFEFIKYIVLFGTNLLFIVYLFRHILKFLQLKIRLLCKRIQNSQIGQMLKINNNSENKQQKFQEKKQKLKDSIIKGVQNILLNLNKEQRQNYYYFLKYTFRKKENKSEKNEIMERNRGIKTITDFQKTDSYYNQQSGIQFDQAFLSRKMIKNNDSQDNDYNSSKYQEQDYVINQISNTKISMLNSSIISPFQIHKQNSKKSTLLLNKRKSIFNAKSLYNIPHITQQKMENNSNLESNVQYMSTEKNDKNTNNLMLSSITANPTILTNKNSKKSTIIQNKRQSIFKVESLHNIPQINQQKLEDNSSFDISIQSQIIEEQNFNYILTNNFRFIKNNNNLTKQKENDKI